MISHSYSYLVLFILAGIFFWTQGYAQGFTTGKLDAEYMSGLSPYREGGFNAHYRYHSEDAKGAGGDMKAGYGFFSNSSTGQFNEIGVFDYSMRFTDPAFLGGPAPASPEQS